MDRPQGQMYFYWSVEVAAPYGNDVISNVIVGDGEDSSDRGNVTK